MEGASGIRGEGIEWAEIAKSARVDERRCRWPVSREWKEGLFVSTAAGLFDLLGASALQHIVIMKSTYFGRLIYR